MSVYHPKKKPKVNKLHQFEFCWKPSVQFFCIKFIFMLCIQYILDSKIFRSLTIYRPGLLRLADRRKFRREKSFRMLEWFARQFSDWFDWGDWWSIKTDDLAKVMIKRGMSSQEALLNVSYHQLICENSWSRIHISIISIHFTSCITGELRHRYNRYGAFRNCCRHIFMLNDKMEIF